MARAHILLISTIIASLATARATEERTREFLSFTVRGKEAAPKKTDKPAAKLTENSRAPTETVSGSGFQLEGWRTYQFGKTPRKTRYEIIKDEGRISLRASSKASASALRHDVSFQANELPRIRWEWKVASSLEGADCSSKKGDDCAARILILYKYDPQRFGFFDRYRFENVKTKTGAYPPGSMLVYAWVESARKEDFFPSPYTDRARVIPVRRGPKDAGKWLTESRNHLKDYRRVFGAEPPPIEAIAILVDTDNTGEEATAWFRSLRVSGSTEKKGR